MKVESKNDRKSSPGECDGCGDSKAKLERFYSYGPGHNVDWLCAYCAISSDPLETRAMAAMFNILERKLRRG